MYFEDIIYFFPSYSLFLALSHFVLFFILTLALIIDNIATFAFNNLHNIIVTNFEIKESLQIIKMQSSAILKRTQRGRMLIRQSTLLISMVKSGSLSHKT